MFMNWNTRLTIIITTMAAINMLVKTYRNTFMAVIFELLSLVFSANTRICRIPKTGMPYANWFLKR